MRPAFLIASIALLGAAPAASRVAIGQFGRWGAFRESPAHCFAAAEPTQDAKGSAYVAVGVTRGPPRLHVVASRASDRPLRLEIDGRAYRLAQGRDARVDTHIIAAIRRADRLRVLGVDPRGRRFHDDYTLAGAPSAIDAAIVACLSPHR